MIQSLQRVLVRILIRMDTFDENKDACQNKEYGYSKGDREYSRMLFAKQKTKPLMHGDVSENGEDKESQSI